MAGEPETVFHVARRDDYRELAPWLVAVGQAPEQQCLHTWSGQSAALLLQQLQGYWDDSELCYVLARQAGQLVGAMGSEYDTGLGRGWLHGPHVAGADWQATAEELFARLLAALPAGIGQLDAYLNVENVRGHRFYAQQGFRESDRRSYEFWLAPGDRVVAGGRGCTSLETWQEGSFVRLFGTLFPKAYYSAERLVAMIGKSHQVLVAAGEQEVLGFAVMSAEEGSSIGEIQFLGVREGYRRQGYGRRLLLAAIDWLLDRAGVSLVCLNVGEDLVHARGLYESVGFKLRFTGVGLEKILKN